MYKLSLGQKLSQLLFSLFRELNLIHSIKKMWDKVCEEMEGKSALGHEEVYSTWDTVGSTIMKVWSFNMPKGTGEGKTPIWVMTNRNWKKQSDLYSMHVNGLLLRVFPWEENSFDYNHLYGELVQFYGLLNLKTISFCCMWRDSCAAPKPATLYYREHLFSSVSCLMSSREKTEIRLKDGC